VGKGRWGLEWILKTSFGDGFRIVWATHDFSPDGILGDFDDVNAPAVKDPGHNFVAAFAEAIASRVYREEDPVSASYCLKSAQADWRSAVEGFSGGTQRFGPLRTAPAGVLASVELVPGNRGSPIRGRGCTAGRYHPELPAADVSQGIGFSVGVFLLRVSLAGVHAARESPG
jgi:hypothetical protein